MTEVPLEVAYDEACKALGEATIMVRLLNARCGELEAQALEHQLQEPSG